MSENPKMIRWFNQHASSIDAISPAGEDIEYKPTELAPIEIQVPLVEYFERLWGFRADPWQKHFCERLQNSLANLHNVADWCCFHAEAQLGKTVILTDTLTPYILGHEPLFQVALLMHNETASWKHSQTIIDIMNLPVHKDIFPNKDGWLEKEKPSQTGWSTRARKDTLGAQLSFNPCGLQSGVTGSGFHWAIIDDPYKTEKEAFSTTVNDSLRDRFEFTIKNRAGKHSNISAMFHRYAPEDLGGYLLDTGEFDYVRYASECDGDYVHNASVIEDAPGDGRVYPDPLGREIGELISPRRRDAAYYEKKKKNKRVWLSMNQGRPSSETGDFFDVSQIKMVPAELAELRKQECVALCRAWDNAATKDAGAYSVGVLMGIKPNGVNIWFDLIRKQVNTGERLKLQKETAKKDGLNVVVTVPDDPGSGGTDTVFFTKQELKGYTVEARATSGSKESRAGNLSSNVNTGMAEMVEDTDRPEEERWNKVAKREMRDFMQGGEFKDIVDASADAYNYLYEVLKKGLCVPTYRPQRNIITLDAFLKEFPTPKGESLIPPKWKIYIGAKLQPDSSKPTSGVIVACAAQNSFLPETLFILDEYKSHDGGDLDKIFKWMESTVEGMCGKNAKDVNIFLHPSSKPFVQTVAQKLKFKANIFAFDEFAGLSEQSWYLRETDKAHPFNFGESAANMYGIVKDEQAVSAPLPNSEGSLYHLRQEWHTWGYSNTGEKPSQIGQVADCLRMVCYQFRTRATTRLTPEEDLEIRMKAATKEVEEFTGTKITEDRPLTMQEQMILQNKRMIADQEVKEKHGVAPYEPEDGNDWWDI